ncbi:hyaluronan and proteoglycan link protein 1-like [Glandiceps talaboti]
MAVGLKTVVCFVVLVQCIYVSIDAAPMKMKRLTIPAAGKKAFLVQGCRGEKTLNFYDAGKECSQRYGAKMAGYTELFRAWMNGYETCMPGWISMGMVLYPMQRASRSCGNRRGLVSHGFKPFRQEFDVYCFPNDRSVYSVIGCDGSLSLTYDQAVSECERRGDVIATYDQLYTEWGNGFEYCVAGWLADGRVGYSSQGKNCNDESGVRLIDVNDYEDGGSGLEVELEQKFDVFCYRQGA